MGRCPWATPEQPSFLESFAPRLEHEKKKNGLKVFYETTVAPEFLAKWLAVPTEEEILRAADKGGDPQHLAIERRTKQIHKWFKSFRSKHEQSLKPKDLLNLTGKQNWKLVPHQFHHAFSLRFYRPKDSPLRQEVDDLWDCQGEQSVIDLLAPFKKANKFPTSRLEFHNAVMRWKCSLLTDQELQEHQDWIDANTMEKEEEAKRPWKQTAEATNEFAAENEFIQRNIYALPATIDVALGEIERSTGMKAIILLGGPTPAKNGDFTTHCYETGRSLDTDLTFSHSWSGYEAFHNKFIAWLRSVYTKEELSQRKGHLALLKPATPPATTVAEMIDTNPAGVTPPTLTSPSPLLSSQQEPPGPRQTHDKPSNSPVPEPEQTTSEPNIEGNQRSASSNRTIAPVSLPTLSPTSQTTGPANDPDQTTNGQESPPDTSDSLTRSHSLPGTFSFRSSSLFISPAAIQYLHTVRAGQRWSDMVNAFLRFEELPPINGSLFRLSAKSQPSEVSQWI